MRSVGLVATLLLGAVAVKADPLEGTAQLVDQCIACHVDEAGHFDIVGIRALEAMPEQWPLQFEDAFDLDGDGVAGRVQYVSGGVRPFIAKWGRNLAATRFGDFALIAAGAHAIPIKTRQELVALQKAFEEKSPDPSSPFASKKEQRRFERAGCAACHVTQTFEADGAVYMPLSDFLLHDLGDGKARRTKPLWGYRGDLWQARHPKPTNTGRALSRE